MHYPDNIWTSGIFLLMLATILACESDRDPSEIDVQPAAADYIQPFSLNPFYWQYKGEPVLLLGGTDQDNLFNHPKLPPAGLEDHLDLLVSSGGNYIRNTMSSRDEGNLWPFKQLENGRYDLDQWNEEYWQRLENLLHLTEVRDIIVQIELWDPWDNYTEEWEDNPWNPKNNINYSTDNTSLATAYARPQYSDRSSIPQDLFLTVPELANDSRVLSYQNRFIEKLLSYTLAHGHILYCITNEIHPHYSPEWGWYWAQFIKEKAAEADRTIYVTEMYWLPDLQGDQHRASLDYPEIYDYFEASQNSAELDPDDHWENLMYIRERLEPSPRPINNTKNYGADTGYPWTGTTQNVIEKFWRNIIAGAASSRFHRPPAGLGLNESAQHTLTSVRMLSDSLNVFRSVPLNEQLTDRTKNEAYAFGEPGVSYAVYFPGSGPGGGSSVSESGSDGSGSVAFEVKSGNYRVTWLDISNSRWGETESYSDVLTLVLEPPASENWVAWIKFTGR